MAEEYIGLVEGSQEDSVILSIYELHSENPLGQVSVSKEYLKALRLSTEAKCFQGDLRRGKDGGLLFDPKKEIDVPERLILEEAVLTATSGE